MALGLGLLWFFVGRTSGPSIAAGSTLVLELSGSYQETARPSILARLFGDERQPFVGLLSTLAMAERDDRLDIVVLRVRAFESGGARRRSCALPSGACGRAGVR